MLLSGQKFTIESNIRYSILVRNISVNILFACEACYYVFIALGYSVFIIYVKHIEFMCNV